MQFYLPNGVLTLECHTFLNQAFFHSKSPSRLSSLILNQGGTHTDCKNIRDFLEHQCWEQLKKLAFFQLYRAQRFDCFGDVSSQEALDSFLRVILNKSLSQTIQSEDMHYVQQMLNQYLNYENWHTYSCEDMTKMIQEFEWDVLGEKISILDVKKINLFFQLIDSSLYFQSGIYGEELHFFLGEASQFKKADYQVAYLHTEWMRSPNTVLSMAAVINHQHILLRHHAFCYVYHQKWEYLLQGSDARSSIDSSRFLDPVVLSTLIKEQAACAWRKTGLLPLKEALIQGILDVVLHHELGHAVVQYHLFNQADSSFAAALALSTSHEMLACLETMAEIAPEWIKPEGSIQGPLLYIAHLASSNLSQAQSLYWMYVSDAFFYDTSDHHLYLYSDLMMMIMVQYINEDKIDFLRLKNDLSQGDLCHIFSQFVTHTLQSIAPFLQQHSAKVDSPLYLTPGSYDYDVYHHMFSIKSLPPQRIDLLPFIHDLYRFYGESHFPRSIEDHRKYLFQEFFKRLNRVSI